MHRDMACRVHAGKYGERRDAPSAEIKLVCPFRRVLFVERLIYLLARVTPSPNRLPSVALEARAIVRRD